MIIPFSVTWTASICFNPYSTGFSSFILDNLKIHREEAKFQSLFYWILFSYSLIYIKPQEDQEVSILILLDSLLLFFNQIE